MDHPRLGTTVVVRVLEQRDAKHGCSQSRTAVTPVDQRTKACAQGCCPCLAQLTGVVCKAPTVYRRSSAASGPRS